MHCATTTSCTVFFFSPISQQAAQWSTSSSHQNKDHSAYLTFSRYQVLSVHDDTVAFTKTLQVATWTADMAPEEDRERERLHKGDGRAWQRRRPPRNSDGTVLLRGEWYYTPVAAGNLIHICSLEGRYRTDILPLVRQTRCCTTLQHDDDDDDLVLIVHPDLLLTPTTISETVSCTRRAILKN